MGDAGLQWRLSAVLLRLINLIVQDCKEQGIETEPESTVIGWLSKWKPEERGV